MKSIPVSFLFGGVLLSAAVQADIYCFTDSSGIAHFSNVPNDPRYERIIESPRPSEPDATSSAAVQTDWLARSAKYDAAIDSAARAATLHPSLLRAVIMVESGFNPRAVSKRGAVGLMQVRPATAKRYGVVNLFDPEQNIRAGTRYLGHLMARFDSLELALAAYNAGEDAVDRYGGRIPPFAETLHYVPNVMRLYKWLRTHPERT